MLNASQRLLDQRQALFSIQQLLWGTMAEERQRGRKPVCRLPLVAEDS